MRARSSSGGGAQQEQKKKKRTMRNPKTEAIRNAERPTSTSSGTSRPSGSRTMSNPKLQAMKNAETPTRGRSSTPPQPAPTPPPKTPKPPKPGTPAAKTPDKVTKKERSLAAKYRKLSDTAHTKITGKTMSHERIKEIKDARVALEKMRAELKKKGYGNTGKKTTKSGRKVTTGIGIYKALTGKKIPPKEEKSEEKGGKKTLAQVRNEARRKWQKAGKKGVFNPLYWMEK